MVGLLLGACLLAQPAVEGTPRELLTMSVIDVEVGTGRKAGPGQRYKVHYTGWLKDGTQFDSSRERPEPLAFVQGRRQVIAGWEAGFEGMRVGGKRRLFIPYQMAYGEKGSGKTIPPRADLIFDVELVAVEDVPEVAAGQDILDALDGLERKVMGLAEAVPEAKWGWRPAAGARSFREGFGHIQALNVVWLSLVARTPAEEETEKLTRVLEAREREPLTKAEVMRELRDGFVALRKAIEPMRAGTLGAEVHVMGRDMTRRGLFLKFLMEDAEQLGALAGYSGF